MKFENRHISYLAPDVFANILNLDEHEQPEINLDMESISMLANNTWFDVPFKLPYNVLHMPDVLAMLCLEVTFTGGGRLSVYINETTVTASRSMVGDEERQVFEFPLLLP